MTPQLSSLVALKRSLLDLNVMFVQHDPNLPPDISCCRKLVNKITQRATWNSLIVAALWLDGTLSTEVNVLQGRRDNTAAIKFVVVICFLHTLAHTHSSSWQHRASTPTPRHTLTPCKLKPARPAYCKLGRGGATLSYTLKCWSAICRKSKEWFDTIWHKQNSRAKNATFES